MKIIYRKRFDKQYRKLSPKLKHAVADVIEIFIDDPSDVRIDNHPLKGKMKGKPAIAVMFDLRIVFEQHDNYAIVVMLEVGTHNQVYRK
jgi:addiction module RelE/StbE family toxin